MIWREEDIVRTKLRLFLVQRAQNRAEEASAMRESIAESLAKIRPLPDLPVFTDEDDMKLLDFNVSMFHGRTAGIWGNGESW